MNKQYTTLVIIYVIMTLLGGSLLYKLGNEDGRKDFYKNYKDSFQNISNQLYDCSVDKLRCQNELNLCKSNTENLGEVYAV